MGRATRPRKVRRYELDFKLQAVRLSERPGVQVQDVADALDIHPFQLSKWRREVRQGILKGSAEADVDEKVSSDVDAVARLKQRLALLEKEHELLKKWTRFCAKLPKTPASSSSKRSRAGSASKISVNASVSRGPDSTRGDDDP